MNKLIAVLALLLSTSALAGTFKTITTDPSGVWVEYTGTVEFEDAEALHDLMKKHRNTPVFVKINSPGGSAIGGIKLYWEAEKWTNLVTYAGKEYGAWSAAAIFWLGSDRDFIEPGGKVGFHAAYCNPWVPPGCNTQPFQLLLKDVLWREGFNAERFNATLNDLQYRFGVNAWLIKEDQSWFVKLPHRAPVGIVIPQGARPLTEDRLERLIREKLNFICSPYDYEWRFRPRKDLPGTAHAPHYFSCDRTWNHGY